MWTFLEWTGLFLVLVGACLVIAAGRRHWIRTGDLVNTLATSELDRHYDALPDFTEERGL